MARPDRPRWPPEQRRARDQALAAARAPVHVPWWWRAVFRVTVR